MPAVDADAADRLDARLSSRELSAADDHSSSHVGAIELRRRAFACHRLVLRREAWHRLVVGVWGRVHADSGSRRLSREAQWWCAVHRDQANACDPDVPQQASATNTVDSATVRRRGES
jgi:hypothetical protein